MLKGRGLIRLRLFLHLQGSGIYLDSFLGLRAPDPGDFFRVEKVTKKTLKELSFLKDLPSLRGLLRAHSQGTLFPNLCAVLLPGEALARLALRAASLGAIAFCHSRQDPGLYTVVRIRCGFRWLKYLLV